jgi:hypothetical protein
MIRLLRLLTTLIIFLVVIGVWLHAAPPQPLTAAASA